MKFGFVIPHNWGLENPQDVLDIATGAEERGFDTVWVNHHILTSGYILDRLDDRPYYDGLTVLTYVAALTKNVRLGTSVLVLPYLNPMVLAKTPCDPGLYVGRQAHGWRGGRCIAPGVCCSRQRLPASRGLYRREHRHNERAVDTARPQLRGQVL